MTPPRLWLDRPSTTNGQKEPKMSGRSRRQGAGRRQATPLPGMRLYGIKCPVSLTLTLRPSAELWIEVSNHEGRFYLNYDASVLDLLKQIQQGGHWIEDNPSTARRKKRARDQK